MMLRWSGIMLLVAGMATRAIGADDVQTDVAPVVDKSPTRGALWATTTATDHVRAGCPQTVRPHARPARGPGGVGYYVGGGAALHGEGRDASSEGTWGTDYQPWALPRIVALQWHHGRKHQGGQGAYRTDGPKLRE